jgi:hypothetical protein
MMPTRAAMPVRWALVLVTLVLVTPQEGAHAQGTGRSMDIDTSIRAAGMGGAGVAVWWGEPGVWGNPASLSTVQGIGWLDGRTKLVPNLDPDIRLDSQRLLLGGGGLGVALTGAPIDGLGKLRLDYGMSEGTDPFGNPTGTFDSFEQVDAWGIGVSPLRVLDAVRHLRRGGEPPAERPFDIAFGFQRKRTQIALAPIALVGVAQATCDDWGASARLSLLPDRSPSAPAHLEISGGFAMLNANDAQFVFANEDVAVPPSRIRRMGFAVHSALPSPWSGGVDTPVRLLVAEVHLLELGFAYDTEHITAGNDVPPFGSPPYDVTRFGIEATLFGVLTGRLGHFHDPSTGVDDVTHGFGVRLPIGPWASVAYDRAFVPQPLGLGDRDRKGWSAWVDPLRIVSDLR